MKRYRIKNLKLLILLITFGLIGCQGTDKKFFPYHINNQSYQHVVENKQVFLVPFHLFTKKTENKKHYTQLSLAIKKYLEKNGYEVLPSKQFELAWNINRLFMGGVTDPKTGKISFSLLNKCLSKTIDDLKRKNTFSAVVIPTLTYQNINLEYSFMQKVGWNGVERKTSLGEAKFISKRSYIATSLDVVVYSRDFSPVFKSKGGLNLITTKKQSPVKQDKIAKELSREHIAEAIEIAFYPFISSSLVEEEMPSNAKKVKLKL